ncbi:MAG: DSD1 family PLP-dependent enzyme [Myxococcota bacterium]
MKLEEVDTPALLLRADCLEQNIGRMASFFATRPTALRPHFKTPKCAEVARLQLEAGASGLTWAKLGEAEALVEAGIRCSILIANQVVGPLKLARLSKLAAKLPELIVAVDDVQQIEALELAVAGMSAQLGALIELNIGMHRCGCDEPEQTVALAQRLERGRVRYRGIMGYEGHAVLIADPERRTALTEQALAVLDRHRQALEGAGLPPAIVSAGGTGTYDQTGDHPGISEIQAGSYVFMDAAYRRVRGEFGCALTLLTTVLRRRGRLLITDAGMKALSQEFGMPEGSDLPLRCVALSEEHGHVLIDEDVELELAAGDRIELLPTHGDTTLNLHDEYTVLRGGQVVARWPIIARGRTR